MLLPLAAVAAVALVVAVIAAFTWLPWALLARRRVAVNLSGGQAFTGVLWARRGPLLVLRDVTHFDGADRSAVDGEVVIERARVEWVQVMPRGN